MNGYVSRTSLVFLFASLPWLALADDADDAREIVNKAIKAQGGEAAIAKYDSMIWKSKGVFHGPNGDTNYTATYSVEWPRKFRLEIDGRFTLVLNGDRGWIFANGNTTDLTEDQLTEQRNMIRALWISRLTPLQSKEFTLATTSESKINDKPAVGVRVSQQDRPDVILYFDKESYLLIKRERRAKPIDLGGVEATVEEFYSNYKDFGGYPFALKVDTKRNGTPLIEAENLELQSVEKLDAGLFEK